MGLEHRYDEPGHRQCLLIGSALLEVLVLHPESQLSTAVCKLIDLSVRTRGLSSNRTGSWRFWGAIPCY